MSTNGERDTCLGLKYSQALEVLYCFAFKLTIATTDSPIQDIIDHTKLLVQFKHVPLFQCKAWLALLTFSRI